MLKYCESKGILVNKSHAACYAITAYYTAWLKYHYTAEYLSSVANDTEFEKIGFIINDMKALGVKTYGPDINESGVGFEVVNGAVRYGLGNIKQVASAAQTIVNEREENGRYTSFENLLERAGVSKDVYMNLIKGGACDAFGKRPELLRKAGVDEEKISADMKALIAGENEVLSTVLSFSKTGNVKPVNNIADVRDGKMYQLTGTISASKIWTGNSGKEFCKFILEDDTGSINVICFDTGSIDKSQVVDGNIVQITGVGKMNRDNVEFTMRKLSPVNLVKSIILTPEKPNYYAPYFADIKKYEDPSGVPLLFVFDGVPKHLFKKTVRQEILDDVNLKKFLTVD